MNMRPGAPSCEAAVKALQSVGSDRIADLFWELLRGQRDIGEGDCGDSRSGSFGRGLAVEYSAGVVSAVGASFQYPSIVVFFAALGL